MRTNIVIKKSQSEFASAYRRPGAPARLLLSMIEADTAAVEQRIARTSVP